MARGRGCCFFLEHAIRDESQTGSGEPRLVSKRLLFVEITDDGQVSHLNYAPYLDYRPFGEGEPAPAAVRARPECAWITGACAEEARCYAIENVVPEHLAEIREVKTRLLDKIEAAVKERLTKEISYWDHRALQLRDQESAGKVNARVNSGEARKRADDLQARLSKRQHDIARERRLAPLPPVVLGGVLVVPIGLIHAITGKASVSARVAVDRQAVAARARAIIMEDRAWPWFCADRL